MSHITSFGKYQTHIEACIMSAKAVIAISDPRCISPRGLLRIDVAVLQLRVVTQCPAHAAGEGLLQVPRRGCGVMRVLPGIMKQTLISKTERESDKLTHP